MLGSAQLRQTYGHYGGMIKSLCFSPDGKYLVSGSCDPIDWRNDSHYLIVASIERKTTESLSAKEYSCSPLAFLPKSNTLIFEGHDNTIQFWDITQGNFLKKYSGDWEDFIMASPDGKYIACKGEGNTIKLLDASSSKLIKTIPARKLLGFSSDGRRMITEGFGSIIQLWNAQTNVLIKDFDSIQPHWISPVITGDFKYLATIDNQSLQIWDVDQNRLIKTLPNVFNDGRLAQAIAISGNGNILATGEKNKINVWSSFSGELIKEFLISDDLEVRKLVFSPDGKYLASGSRGGKLDTKNLEAHTLNGVVHIWNIENYESNSLSNLSPVILKSDKPEGILESVDLNIPITNKINPNRFALVIGNEDYNRYQNSLSSEQNVKFARNDAAIFKEYLTKTLGFPTSNVFLLTDATRGQIGRELDRLTQLAKLNLNSEIVFYYAGHGFPDFNTKEGYIIPVDVTASYLQDAISLKDLYKKLASSKASRIIVFLDACFSGGGRGENGLLAARTVRIKPKGDIVEGNIVAFTASSGEEVSLPSQKEPHGLFTYCLLRKLKDTKGNVTLDELRTYLEAELPKASLIENSMKQTPQVLTAPDLGDKWLNWKWQ